MSNVLMFVAGIGVTLLAYMFFGMYRKVMSLTVNLAVLERSIAEIKDHAELLGRSIDVYTTASKDNDKAANAIAKSAVQLQDLLSNIQAIMMPPEQPEDLGPTSMFSMQNSFESIQKELIEQGIDPELAKFKAAEYELEKLSSGDLSEISMSL